MPSITSDGLLSIRWLIINHVRRLTVNTLAQQPLRLAVYCQYSGSASITSGGSLSIQYAGSASITSGGLLSIRWLCIHHVRRYTVNTLAQYPLHCNCMCSVNALCIISCLNKIVYMYIVRIREANCFQSYEQRLTADNCSKFRLTMIYKETSMLLRYRSHSFNFLMHDRVQ